MRVRPLLKIVMHLFGLRYLEPMFVLTKGGILVHEGVMVYDQGKQLCELTR